MEYKSEIEISYRNKIESGLSALPGYIRTYIEGRENRLSIKTRYAYIQDLRIFLEYIQKSNPLYKDTDIKDIPLDVFDTLTTHDINEFLKNVEYYEVSGKVRHNGLPAKQRKLATLRSFYKFCNQNEMITKNPTLAVENIRIEEKDILALNSDEVVDFLEVVKNGTGMEGKQLSIQKKNADRDVAIYTLLFGTGIRISEMVGLNINGIDLKHKEFRVVRKGGNEEIIHFGESVCECLDNYIHNVRPKYLTADADPDPLFLSLKGNRLSVRRIEDMTKIYASIALPAKHITPHKMRSTFGSFIYNATGDAGLVASMLGHSNVDITLKRYAKLDSVRKEKAAEIATKMWGES